MPEFSNGLLKCLWKLWGNWFSVFFLSLDFDLSPFAIRDGAHYIPDIFNDEILYLEIMEDFYYVLLNLILAKKILYSIDMNKEVNINDPNFFQDIKSIIENHYNEYAEQYKDIENLRWYTASNYRSINFLDIIHKEVKNNLGAYPAMSSSDMF